MAFYFSALKGIYFSPGFAQRGVTTGSSAGRGSAGGRGSRCQLAGGGNEKVTSTGNLESNLKDLRVFNGRTGSLRRFLRRAGASHGAAWPGTKKVTSTGNLGSNLKDLGDAAVG